jgi:RNA polymerase sigma factor (sigma-70 family)
VSSPLDAMMQAYGRLPIPTREEQVLLGRKIRAWLDWEPSLEEQQQGIIEPPKRLRRAGERAREQLISRNMLLVADQARSFSVSSTPALELQDLIQEGAIGLCRAAELFDPALGYAFSTYAVLWIRQSMTRLVHGSGAIHIPTKRSQAMHGLRKWCEAFNAREGRPPTDAEQLAAGLTGVQRSGDLVILRQAAAVYQLRSLDVVMGDEDSDTWLSTVAAPANDPQPTASNRELDQVLQMLQPWPVLQEVMERRLAGQPFCEISLAMGMSERAAIRRGRQAMAMAMAMARNRIEGAELQEEELDSDEPPAETAPAPQQHVVYVQPSLLPDFVAA